MFVVWVVRLVVADHVKFLGEKALHWRCLPHLVVEDVIVCLLPIEGESHPELSGDIESISMSISFIQRFRNAESIIRVQTAVQKQLDASIDIRRTSLGTIVHYSHLNTACLVSYHDSGVNRVEVNRYSAHRFIIILFIMLDHYGLSVDHLVAIGVCVESAFVCDVIRLPVYSHFQRVLLGGNATEVHIPLYKVVLEGVFVDSNFDVVVHDSIGYVSENHWLQISKVYQNFFNQLAFVHRCRCHHVHICI